MKDLAREPILLVEDDPTDVLMIRRALSKAGVANPVHVVSDGDAAVAYLSGAEPYADRARYPFPLLAILDLKLPRRSGHEVLAWLRAEPVLRRLPVVILTSSRASIDLERAYDLGANSYLVKPVDSAALVDMMAAVRQYWLGVNVPPQIAS